MELDSAELGRRLIPLVDKRTELAVHVKEEIPNDSGCETISEAPYTEIGN